MARRRRPPSEVVLHQPVPFSDATDSPDSQEGVSTPREGVSPWLDSRPLPLSPRPLAVLPLRSVSAGVRGGTPLAKPFSRRSLPVTVSATVKLYKGRFHAKQIRPPSRGGIPNTLAVPYSRRARFCLIRKQRREVIFATRKNGRNGGKVYRRTPSSQWRC